MIEWNNLEARLGELKEYEYNPRKISKKAFDKLVKSLKEDGYHQRIIINYDGTILGGHQRKKALLKAGYTENSIIEVLTPNRQLTEDEIDRINIRDNLPFGEFDFEMLSNRFDVDTLVDFGMDEDWLLGKEEEALDSEPEIGSLKHADLIEQLEELILYIKDCIGDGKHQSEMYRLDMDGTDNGVVRIEVPKNLVLLEKIKEELLK